MASPSPEPATSAAGVRVGDRDLLIRIERYLAKRDGVDKLLKISRYAAKIALAATPAGDDHPLRRRLKSFESSVGVSRKAFRLGKFVQDINAYRAAAPRRPFLAAVAYGGEGLYYFVEQLVWLTKAGLIDPRHAPRLQKISAWAELVGYVGSLVIKGQEVMVLTAKVTAVKSEARGLGEELEKVGELMEKLLLKKMSIVQDIADAVMAIADVRDGKGVLSGPLLMACAGLLSALISSHKNWSSC